MNEKLNVTLFSILFWITAPIMAVTTLIFIADPIKVGWFLRNIEADGAWQATVGALITYGLVFLVFFFDGLKKDCFNDGTPVLKVIEYALQVAFYANIVLIVAVAFILAYGGIKNRFDLFLLGFNNPR